MDTSSVEVQRVASPKDRKAFVMLPWKVYRGDRNWVPPLISEALKQISPEHNPFFQRAEVELFLARRGRKVVGTIAVYVDPYRLQMIGEQEANFGFFEVLEDYEAAQALLDTAREWATARGMEHLVGPYNFNESDRPGVLIAGADCPPVILAGHTPPYYRDFLERYGFQKHHDVYAWRAFREQIGEEMRNLPPALLEVAEEARRREEVTLRKVDLDRWDEEIAVAHRLFTETLKGMHYYAPVPREDFERLARRMRPL
ncbi:MAG: GNAT family N-acetyltransferase, partial [Anaerolineae bacterium]|nr:GNAT family N-acetyltransferase [Anaerolineae bacterium]